MQQLTLQSLDFFELRARLEVGGPTDKPG